MNKFLSVVKNKVFWIVILLLIIISLLVASLFSVYRNVKGETTKVVIEETTMIESEFKGFILYKDSTDYQKELFAQLEELYPTSVFDEGLEDTGTQVHDYLDVYTKNFLADYLTLNVKDVEFDRYGGRQFMLPLFATDYIESNGVMDYYVSKDYYVINNPDNYKETLPEISNLELVSFEPTTFDYYDAKFLIPERPNIPAFDLTYNVTYSNPGATEFNYYSTITVTLANWDGVWSVFEVRTDAESTQRNVISLR